jgi:hypothetical protein
MAGLDTANTSVVIYDLYIERVAVDKAKADTPLVIDPDRMPSCTVAFQQFKPIRRGQSQIFYMVCGIQLLKPHDDTSQDLSRQAPALARVEKLLCLGISKRSDHCAYKQFVYKLQDAYP